MQELGTTESEMTETAFYSIDYYQERERAERELANKATSTAIRKIHLEMAERYRELAQQFERPSSFRVTV
jgi:hypothetical protein